MTLILKVCLEMVMAYLHIKNEVPKEQTDRQTDITENITYPNTRSVTMICSNLWLKFNYYMIDFPLWHIMSYCSCIGFLMYMVWVLQVCISHVQALLILYIIIIHIQLVAVYLYPMSGADPGFFKGWGASEILPTLRIQSCVNEENLGLKIGFRGGGGELLAVSRYLLPYTVSSCLWIIMKYKMGSPSTWAYADSPHPSPHVKVRKSSDNRYYLLTSISIFFLIFV